MHDLQRTIVGLLMTSFVLLPGASAAGAGIDLDTSVSVEVDAIVGDAATAASDAIAGTRAGVDQLSTDVEERADAALDGVEAQASAEIAAGEAEARGALASIEAALAALGEFASGLFARVDVAARLGRGA